MSSFPIWGWHSVRSVLANPRRRVHKVLISQGAFEKKVGPLTCPLQIVSPSRLTSLLPPEAVHQGVAAWVDPLDSVGLDTFCPKKGVVLALDEIVDPHNVGALWRSAAAFGAQGLLLTKRHSPPLEGTVAKSACGAMEVVPHAYVSNLVYALEDLKKKGFFSVGLCEEGAHPLEIQDISPVVLVVGAEATGLRRLTRETCDLLVSISCASSFSTLNASVAGAIALHHFGAKKSH